jgi:serine/threonine protein kinase
LKPDLHVLGGRFRVLSHLGGGGMAEVYLAEQVSLGRRVALKVLKRDLGKRPDMAERFRREARILCTVDHPSVVRVIDFESAPEATILVLELAEGDTLEKVMKPGPMSPDRAIPILAQIADGLGAIHEKGIVHRDIKPQNVVLTPTPRGDQARLLDFGIARLMEIPDGLDGAAPLGGLDNPFISQPGQVVGTPAYVAPEQATAGTLDTRTDVYSFGVLAYRMLSGQFPFPGPGSQDFLKQHLLSPPRLLDEVMPSLKERPALVLLVMDCLQKSPDARPKNGHVLLERLMPMMPPSPYESSVTTPSRRLFNGTSAGSLAPVTSAAPAAAGRPSKWAEVQQRTSLIGEASLTQARRAIVVASKVDREWWRSLIWTAVIIGTASAAFAMLPATPAQRAAKMIENGGAEQAITLLNEREVEAPAEVPELTALKAAALHRLDRHSEERALLRERTYQALHAAHPLLLEALAEDFATSESDAELRAMMEVVPPDSFTSVFEAFATGKRSRKQWGALRYLDFAGIHQKLDRVELYALALIDRDCEVRAKAAVRLSELGDRDAVDALRELSELPKEERSSGQYNCGQDEAAEAIRQLKREKK